MVASLTRWLTLGALAAGTLSVHALDTQLDGINYDLRQGPDWDPKKCKGDDTIAAELKQLKTITKNVRTYSLSDCDVTPVLKHAKELGLTVWLGVWISGDDSVFQNECKNAQKLIDAGLIDSNVVGINVGSEAVYRKDVTPEKAIEYLKSFQALLKKNSLTIPTAITDISDTMTAYPDLVAAGDVVTVNQFPFWEKVKPSEAAAQFLKRINPLLKIAGDKQVIITETGWPTAGINENASIASPEASARFLNDFVLLAKAQKWRYYYFQGFDSPWKAAAPGEENTVEGNFGLFTKDATMKPVFTSLKVAKQTDNSKADAGMGSSTGGGGGGAGVGSPAGGNGGGASGNGGGAGGNGGGAGGNGAVHGATGSNVDANGISRDNSTTPGNNQKSGAGNLSRSIVAIVAAVMSLAVYQ